MPTTETPSHAGFDIDTGTPVFFGHAGLTGQPAVLSPHAARVDHSAGEGAPPVAHRRDGESVLTNRRFVRLG